MSEARNIAGEFLVQRVEKTGWLESVIYEVSYMRECKKN